MARASKASDRPKKLKSTDSVVPTEQLSDVEIADAQRASALADETARTESGEKGGSNRLPYKLLTKEGMEYLHAVAPFLTRPNRFGIFEPIARAFGASLPVEQVQRVVRFDPSFKAETEVVCTGTGCGYRIGRALAMVSPYKVGDDGVLPTDERLVNETNPEGLEYEGVFSVIRENPSDRYSKFVRIGSFCRKCQKAGGTAYHAKTGKWPKNLSMAEADAFIAAENAKKSESRQNWLSQKDQAGRDFGVVDSDNSERGGNRGRGGFRSGPRLAQAGQPGRERDSREANIGNRTRVVSQ